MSDRLLIGVELTQHCNLRCVHCLRADTRTRGELDLELFERILEQAHAYGEPHLAFTGGEPLLHSRLLALLERLRAHRLTAGLVTNGLAFPLLAPELERFRDVLPAIAFSLDGASEATHDRLRGRGTFRRALFAIALARHRGFGVTVQMAVNRHNRAELQRMPALCADLGAQALYVTHTQPTRALYAAGLQLDPDAWRAVEEEVRALARAGRGVAPRLSVGSHSPALAAPCMALQHRSINIDHRGRLTLCCQLSGVSGDPRLELADLRVTPLAEAHRRLAARIAEVTAARLERWLSGAASPLDAFHCWPCHKLFGTLDFLRDFPDDPWARDADLAPTRRAVRR